MVEIRVADEPTAVRLERYLKSGSGRAFSKRHFEPASMVRFGRTQRRLVLLTVGADMVSNWS